MTVMLHVLKRSGPFAGAVLSAFLVSPAASQSMSSDAVPPAAAQSQTSASGPTFPYSIQGVLKMVDGGVGNDVVKTYVENSQSAYRPTVDEIIALKNRGVSQDIIVAMLKRDGELKAQMAQAVAASQAGLYPPAPSAPSPAVAAPVYDYGAQPAPVYSSAAYSSYPAYVYDSYPSYGYWGGVGFVWPYYSCGYPYCNYYRSYPRGYPQYFGGFHRGYYGAGGFHGSFNGGFHGGVSFQGHSGGFHSPGIGGRTGGGRFR
jgi:hypothetical protein